jgi:hypothetical protein
LQQHLHSATSSATQHEGFSEAHVRAALHYLLYTTTSHRDNPIERLLVVDDILSSEAAPSEPTNRRLGVAYLLTDTITEVLMQYRNRVGISRAQDTDTIHNVAAQIARDANEDNVELMSWSWLYYRFVRVDLSISAKQFQEWVGIDERTLRRYQKHGIRRLTEALSSKERAVRRQRRRLLACRQLPMRAIPFVGREYALERLSRKLLAEPTQCIYIGGEAGIGKSALVCEILHRQIEHNQVQKVVWIDKPQTWEEVQERFASAYAETSGSNSTSSVAVVLDGIEHLQNRLPIFSVLSKQFHQLALYLIGRETQWPSETTAAITLSGLNQQETEHLCRRLEQVFIVPDYAPLTSAEVDDIWNTTRGNPAQIRGKMQQILLDMSDERTAIG